ncbi:hypothetical protein DV702_08840 [Sporosarcina sp. PTS2304]|uniref:hypothetical protein n=1 Tax=Sporosarcina sp. PTS2304 TaxID=2283194 RepID=UPI000E0D4699|nr:hypothetical protein [Sporosarcina sp. PTS2304]AXH99832.1 hypothetical protein DV702_08840 [Sporosarcina sp. PTS2304]
MNPFVRLLSIGIVSGFVLAILLQLVYWVTGNEAYVLLYNVDYFPLIHVFDESAWFGIFFHFIFCIVSVVGLYYLLSLIGFQFLMWPYIAVYTAGSGVLFFLTSFTEKAPATDDGMAWFY